MKPVLSHSIDQHCEGIRGVLLDAVGTIMEANPSVTAVYAQAAAEQGVILSAEQIKRRFVESFSRDRAIDQAHSGITDETRERRRWQRIVADCLPELPEPDRAFEQLWKYFGQPSAWRLYEDVLPLLEQLDRVGITVRIGSNFDARLRNVLSGLNLPDQITQQVLISSEIGFVKPSRQFYQAVTQVMGLDARAILSLGDDLVNDVEGPQEIGMRAILVDRRDRNQDDSPRVLTLAELHNPLSFQKNKIKNIQ